MADSESKVQEFLDDLNEAMALHAQNAVKNLQFDRTELAEIVDISNAEHGEYQVDNGSTRYSAYSENTSYTLGTKVYVVIPNNDYTQQKRITGKYKSKDGSVIDYVSPLNQYQPLTDNLMSDNSEMSASEQIFANMDLSDRITVNKNYDNTTGTWLSANFYKNLSPHAEFMVLYHKTGMKEGDSWNKDYSFMGIQADFKTLLKSYNTISGEYGILVLMDVSHRFDVTSERKHELKIYDFNNSMMLGDIYNFNTWYQQEALYKLDNGNGMIIHEVAVLFYQNGNFKDDTGNYIDSALHEQDGSTTVVKNIGVRNIDIKFGNEIVDDPGDIAKIYTLNGLSYDSAQTDAELNKKRIYLNWMHKNEEPTRLEDGTKKYEYTEITSINGLNPVADGLRRIAAIHWYRNDLYDMSTYRAQTAKDEANQQGILNLIDKELAGQIDPTDEALWESLIAEMGWTADNNGADINHRGKAYYSQTWNSDGSNHQYSLTDAGVSALETAKNKITRTAKSKDGSAESDALAGNNWMPIQGSENQFSIAIDPNVDKGSTSIKCIIEYSTVNSENKVNTSSAYYTTVLSKELTFTNASWVPDDATQLAASGIVITIDDGTNGRYPFYNGNDNRILNRRNIETLRTMIADLRSPYTGKSFFNGNETILWRIPKTNSMININGLDKGSTMTSWKYDNVTDFSKWLQGKEKFDPDNYYYILRRSNDGNPVSNTQGFYINEYYSKNAGNNTVTCWMLKNGKCYTGSLTMTFSQYGTCGTNYTFALCLGELVDENFNSVGPSAPALTIGEKYWREILFNLYDANNNEIFLSDKEKNDIIKEWRENDDLGYYSGKENSKNLDFKVNNEQNPTRIAVKCKTNNIIDYRYIILAASVRSDAQVDYKGHDYTLNNINFTQYLPLHVRLNDKYYVEGSDYITYDDKGINPQYFNTAYTLINNSATFGLVGEGAEDKYAPHFSDNKLIPSPIYVDNLNKELSIEANVNGSPVYVMPLLVIQNAYAIPAVNSWDGQLLLDKDNNRVMAATIAAGTKDTENRFNGVLMGKIQEETGIGYNTKNGLIGFNKGAQSFGWLTDGTGFIGKSGTGRIEFNGQRGTIKSATYDSSGSTDGMLIDLEDGYIDMWGSEGSRIYSDNYDSVTGSKGEGSLTNIHIDPRGPYFKINVPAEGDDNRTNLIYIDNGNYYLQTADYEYGGTQKGLKIDLKNGRFDSKGPLSIKSESTNSELVFGNNNSHLTLGASENQVSLSINSGGRATLNSTGEVSIKSESTNSHLYFKEGSGELAFGGNALKLGYNNSKAYLDADGKLVIRGDSKSSINFGNLTIKGEGSMSGPNWHIDADGGAYFNDVRTLVGGKAEAGSNGIDFHQDGKMIIAGDIYANNGYFNGKITSAEGQIGGWSINNHQLYSGDVYLDSSTGYIHGAYIDGGTVNGAYISGGTVHASRIDADESIYLNGKPLGWSPIEYMTEITDISRHSATMEVVTNIKSGEKGFTVTKATISWLSNITITYNTATAYILGNAAGKGGSKTAWKDGPNSIGGQRDESVSISGFASSTHHHTGSMYGTATVDITTGSGTASVSGGVGGPIG